MFKNYLKIAIRNLLKHSGYSLINLLGLAIGMACFLIILLYIKAELSYDRFHENADRIYRVAVDSKRPQRESYDASTPYPVAPALRAEFPEMEKIARVYVYGDALIDANDKRLYEKRFLFADPDFFDIFSFRLLQGNPAEVLANPNSIVLTKSTAERYFGNIDPTGKIVRFENYIDFQVTGIVEDPPANSHFKFDFLASFQNVDKKAVGFNPDQWGAFIGIYTYVLLPENTDLPALESKLEPFYNAHAGQQTSVPRRLFLQPITDIHLHSHFETEIEPNNSVTNLIVLGTIALFILLLACINFMNLSTARSVRRAREVGMRKVLGAKKVQLVKQFLGESILLSVIALLLALVLIEIMLPIFSELIGKSMQTALEQNIWGVLALLGIAVAVGIVAGTYPAFVLSSHKPVETVKGPATSAGARGSAFALRKILVVAQFTISVALIAGTLIMQRQLHYFNQANLGFDKELTLLIPMNDESVSKKYEAMKNEFERQAGVQAVTAAFKSPIGSNEFTTSLYPDGKDGEARFQISLNFIDYDFIENFGLKMIAGRNFAPEFTGDLKNSFIVNEATIKELGYARPEDAIGRKVVLGLNSLEGTIVGVTEDFHIESLHEPIEPLVMMYWPDFFNVFCVKIQATDISGTLTHLRQIWEKFVPQFPFQYRFLDQYIASLYEAEQKTEKLIGMFSILAIIIACLGLFGLAAFTAEQRTKEIGVRKVLGATVTGIVGLMSKDFAKLILIANLLAWPLAWFAMNRWLQEFAFRIDIEWWMFALAGGLALLIALLTVCTQAIKAALTNPVESLRYE